MVLHLRFFYWYFQNASNTNDTNMRYIITQDCTHITCLCHVMPLFKKGKVIHTWIYNNFIFFPTDIWQTLPLTGTTIQLVLALLKWLNNAISNWYTILKCDLVHLCLHYSYFKRYFETFITAERGILSFMTNDMAYFILFIFVLDWSSNSKKMKITFS